MFLFETTSNNVFIQQFGVLDKKIKILIPCNQLNTFFLYNFVLCYSEGPNVPLHTTEVRGQHHGAGSLPPLDS